jgi:hypothetical protein
MSGNTWTNFVKDFARENGTSYMEAIKHPDLSVAYKTHKKGVKTRAKQDNFDFLKKSAIELAGDAPTGEPILKENENIILQTEEINV